MASETTNPTGTRAKSVQDTNLKSAIDLAWAFIEFDPKGKILNANENFVHALGYEDLSEIKGKHHRIFCAEAYEQSEDYAQFWQDLGNGMVKSGEFERKTKAGKSIWISASYAPVKDSAGKVKKVLKIASDITDMVALRVQAAGIKSAVDISMAMIEFTPEGIILDANDNFLATMGYSLSAIKGKHHKMFCDEEFTSSEEYARFWPALASGESMDGEFCRFDSTGREVWLQAAYTPVKNSRDEVVKIIKLASNITDRKRETSDMIENIRTQEEELRQNLEEIQATQEEVERNSQRIRKTLDQAVDAIVTINSRKEITYINPAAVQMFGHREEDVLGKEVKVLAPVIAQVSQQAQDDYGMDDPAGKTQDFEVSRKDQSKFWANISLSKVEIGGELNFTAFIKDVTEARQNLMRAQSLESAVNSSWASIEFEPDGTIISANDNFVKALGYQSSAELSGRHHRIFCEYEYANSAEYASFWDALGNGKMTTGEFLRQTKQGQGIWINASYTPVFDEQGKVVKVIKIANDITKMVESRLQASAVKSAVDTGWASIEFEPDGTIITANDNFISTLGYHSVDEIKGKHHRIFCSPGLIKSDEYQKMWYDLANGISKSGEFERMSKLGESVWINASYTPVRDERGKVFKVIKIANEITQQKEVIKAIQDVVREAGDHGNLSARVHLNNAEGDYQILADAFNRLMDNIVEPFSQIKELLIRLSQGDLSEDFLLDVQGDFKEMGSAFNEALANLNQLILQINDSANLVVKSAKEMSGKGEQMKGSTQEMASAIQQMAEGVQDQAQQIDQANSLIAKILTNAKDTALKADVINKSAEEGQRNSKEGVSTIEAVVENMQEIQGSATVTSESIKVLTKRSEEIARTLNVITDIASQTNLLALNAAIEAARAGEAGRGFAVVAEEIRKLAEDSRKSAQDIEKVISEVQNDINQASKSIEGMEVSVKNGNKAGGEAEAVFKRIDAASIETLNLSKQILESAAIQEEAINGTVKNIEKVVVVSEETSAGTEQIASSSQELNQGMDEVSATSVDLADVAYQLLEGVSKFKLRKQ
ncbi:PAS domain S-box protein [Persicobacter psychrovividus]|uniref:Chemotaxis protein n=1 Tax=Persicobacter psychrovividus TaxID=387638 RepID=A0ABM7VLI0_9BACT|nr:hypothetical protein PEPS_41380 [Persicobacter psychrovividus]